MGDSLPAGRAEKRGGWVEKVVDVKEAKLQIMIAVPMVLTNVSYYVIPLISVMFAGHLGVVELAGATLGNSWSTVTGLALMTGLSGSLETFCGQNFGAKMYRMLGIHLQASMIITFLSSILISILWVYTEPVLNLLHQNHETSKLAAIYLRYLIPGLFAYAFLQCLLRFLQTQSIVIPLVVCSLVPLGIHVGLTYLLVHVSHLGLKGASLSATITLWLSLFMLAFYVKFSNKFRQTWQGLSMECFKHVLPNLKLAIPSAVMVCLEFWAFEILVVIAGLMPNSQTSTSLIAMCVTTEGVIFNLIVGFSAAVSTRVSNEIGAKNIDKAKNAIVVTLKLCVALTLVMVLLLIVGHNVWAKLFTNSSSIIKEFAHITPFLAISFLLDATQGVLSGVARGCGWQHLAAWTNLVGFYVVGMPLSIVFGFVLKLHVKGLWIGLICGLFCQASILLIITLRINWEKLVLHVGNTQTDGHV